MEARGPNHAEPRQRRRGKRIAVLAIATLVTWIAADLGLAHLLFGERYVPSWAQGLREPQLWAGEKEELYHRLQSQWGAGIKDQMWAAIGHPEFGWLAGAIDPDTLRHKDEAAIGERRPILLYGDSFARGVGRREARFQGLLEQSDLAERYALLNYGTGGYGTDQTLLLMRATVPLYADLDPIVVFSFLVDDDLDRSSMGFKSGVRPRLGRTSDGELVNVGGPCTSRAEYFERAPTPRFGYSLRLLSHSSLWPGTVGAWLSGEERRIAATQDLNQQIFAAVQHELEALGVEGFVLMFHGLESARSTEPWLPHEPFVLETLNELGLPFVSTRRDLWRAVDGDLDAIGELFIPPDETGRGHYTPRGNVAAFETLRRGLEQRFQTLSIEWPEPDDGFVPRPVSTAPAFDDLSVHEPDPDTARWRHDEDRDMWRIAPGRRGPTELSWDLEGRAWRLELTADLVTRIGPRGELSGPIDLEVEVDGESVWKERIVLEDDPRPVRALLKGKQRLVLRIGRTGEGTPGWLILRNPLIR